MKLYFTPGACSLSPHIVLREAGLVAELERVDLRARRTASGVDYLTVNPKGYVPTLELDDGQRLTECAAIVQYLADVAPSAGLAPPAGDFERVRLQEWLNFIGTEIHKTAGSLMSSTATEDFKARQRELLGKRFDYVVAAMDGAPFLMGERFTVADAYLFTLLNWAPMIQVDMSAWPSLQAYHARIAERPAVHAAMKAEGLLG